MGMQRYLDQFSTFAVLHLINWQLALNNQEVYTFFTTKELKHETTKKNSKKRKAKKVNSVMFVFFAERNKNFLRFLSEVDHFLIVCVDWKPEHLLYCVENLSPEGQKLNYYFWLRKRPRKLKGLKNENFRWENNSKKKVGLLHLAYIPKRSEL